MNARRPAVAVYGRGVQQTGHLGGQRLQIQQQMEQANHLLAYALYHVATVPRL